jgi:hypothetical protein
MCPNLTRYGYSSDPSFSTVLINQGKNGLPLPLRYKGKGFSINGYSPLQEINVTHFF